MPINSFPRIPSNTSLNLQNGGRVQSLEEYTQSCLDEINGSSRQASSRTNSQFRGRSSSMRMPHISSSLRDVKSSELRHFNHLSMAVYEQISQPGDTEALLEGSSRKNLCGLVAAVISGMAFDPMLLSSEKRMVLNLLSQGNRFLLDVLKPLSIEPDRSALTQGSRQTQNSQQTPNSPQSQRLQSQRSTMLSQIPLDNRSIALSPLSIIVKTAHERGVFDQSYWQNVLDLCVEAFEAGIERGSEIPPLVISKYLEADDKAFIVKQYPTTQTAALITGQPQFMAALERCYQNALGQNAVGHLNDFDIQKESFYHLIKLLNPGGDIHAKVVEQGEKITAQLQIFDRYCDIEQCLDMNSHLQQKAIDLFRSSPVALLHDQLVEHDFNQQNTATTATTATDAKRVHSPALQAFMQASIDAVKQGLGMSSVITHLFDLFAKEPSIVQNSELADKFSSLMAQCNKKTVIKAFLNNTQLQRALLNVPNAAEPVMALNVKKQLLSKLLLSGSGVEQIGALDKSSQQQMRRLLLKVVASDARIEPTAQDLTELCQQQVELFKDRHNQTAMDFLMAELSEPERNAIFAQTQSAQTVQNGKSISELKQQITQAMTSGHTLPIGWEHAIELTAHDIDVKSLLQSLKVGDVPSKQNFYALANQFPEIVFSKIGGYTFAERAMAELTGKGHTAVREAVVQLIKQQFDPTQHVPVWLSMVESACDQGDWRSVSQLMYALNRSVVEHSEGMDSTPLRFDTTDHPVFMMLDAVASKAEQLSAKGGREKGGREIEKGLINIEANKLLKAAADRSPTFWGLLNEGPSQEKLSKRLNHDATWKEAGSEALQEVAALIKQPYFMGLREQLFSQLLQTLYINQPIDLAESASAVLQKQPALNRLMGIDVEQLTNVASSHQAQQISHFFEHVVQKQQDRSPLSFTHAVDNLDKMVESGFVTLSVLMMSAQEAGQMSWSLALFNKACEQGDVAAISEVMSNSAFTDSLQQSYPNFNPVKRALLVIHQQVVQQQLPVETAKKQVSDLLSETVSSSIVNEFFNIENPLGQVAELEQIAHLFYDELTAFQSLSLSDSSIE